MVEPEATFQLGDPAKLAAEVERIRQKGNLEPASVAVPSQPAAVSVAMVEVEVTCRECGEVFKTKALNQDGQPRLAPKLCDKCRATFDAESLRLENEERQRVRSEAWNALCPPLYRDTDPAKLRISQDVVGRITAWAPQPQGIGLSGDSGAGKTRLMFLLLQRLHFSGVRCQAFTAKRFESWCHRMFEKDDSARTNILNAKTVPVLFIDDIGKEKYTERVESEFYDLIEHRTSHLLPILWTANATGQQLVKMMGEDRGTPIVRRLREFSTIISV